MTWLGILGIVGLVIGGMFLGAIAVLAWVIYTVSQWRIG